MLVQDRETVIKSLGKIAFIIGFFSAVIGYSFHPILKSLGWNGAFYHLIAFAFVCYLYEVWASETRYTWKVVKFGVLMTACNSLSDEIRGIGAKFDVGEYILLIVILIYTIYFLKTKE